MADSAKEHYLQQPRRRNATKVTREQLCHCGLTRAESGATIPALGQFGIARDADNSKTLLVFRQAR